MEALVAAALNIFDAGYPLTSNHALVMTSLVAAGESIAQGVLVVVIAWIANAYGGDGAWDCLGQGRGLSMACQRYSTFQEFPIED